MTTRSKVDLEAESKRYRCPHPSCKFKSKTLSGLKNHYRRQHNHGWCIVCGRKFMNAQRLLQHCQLAGGDQMHLALYYLLRNARHERVGMLSIGKRVEAMLRG